MKRHNKINDKTWNAIEWYEFIKELRKHIFYDIMFAYSSQEELSVDEIETPFGFSITLEIRIDEITDPYTDLAYTIHLKDENGQETNTISFIRGYGIGIYTGETIMSRIDDDISDIFREIKHYETYEKKDTEKEEIWPF